MSITLKQLLIDHLPPSFVCELIDRMPGLYMSSHGVLQQDPDLDKSEAQYCLGYYRRGQAETLLRRLARKHGVTFKEVQPAGGGPSHVALLAGPFELVMCHVGSRGAFPKYSLERESASKANEYIDQIDWLNEPKPAQDS
ncbi:hypothetical protein, partial [Congregibacter litoralis]